MRPDALHRAALSRAVLLSADVEAQLRSKRGGQPVVALLDKARSHAAAAIVKLAEVDPEDAAAVRAQQNEVVCFQLIVTWLQEIVAAGFDASDEIDMAGREEAADLLGLNDTPEDED